MTINTYAYYLFLFFFLFNQSHPSSHQVITSWVMWWPQRGHTRTLSRKSTWVSSDPCRFVCQCRKRKGLNNWSLCTWLKTQPPSQECRRACFSGLSLTKGRKYSACWQESCWWGHIFEVIKICEYTTPKARWRHHVTAKVCLMDGRRPS